jgi:hypothetical protein
VAVLGVDVALGHEALDHDERQAVALLCVWGGGGVSKKKKQQNEARRQTALPAPSPPQGCILMLPK